MADFKMSMQYQVIRNQYCGVVNNKVHLQLMKYCLNVAQMVTFTRLVTNGIRICPISI